MALQTLNGVVAYYETKRELGTTTFQVCDSLPVEDVRGTRMCA